jgi:hypothetical protein
VKIELSANEARVIGCLIEKQITTPDQYPLSLNALTNACNQKSNRDPLMALDEHTVQQVVDGLVRKHLVIEKSGFGSRVPKFQHIFCNTEFGSLKFTPLETAIVCELLLRGPQTPGELRTRAQRMAPVGEVAEVEAALRALAQRPEGAIVVQLPREPGRRDSRHAHLLSGDIDVAALAESQAQTSGTAAVTSERAPAAIDDSQQRLERLETLVGELRAEIDALKARLG